METRAANYRIITEPETRRDGTKAYNASDQRSQDALAAYCPTLQVTDYGDSIEEV